MVAVSLSTPRRIRVRFAAVVVAVIVIAVAMWVQHSDSPAYVEAVSASTLPAAVQQTFADTIRSGFDARGRLDVTYVQSTLRTADSFITFGDQNLADSDTPVYVLFVKGSFNSVGGSAAGGVTPLPGGIVAIIGTDGSEVMTAGYGNTVPELSKLGTPSTTVVDVGT